MILTQDGPGPFTEVAESDDARGLLERYSNIPVAFEKGSRAWILCPFHNDTNASMSAKVGGRSWKCWSCNKVCSTVDLIAHVTSEQPLQVAINILNGGNFTVNRNRPEPKPVMPPNPLLNSAVMAYIHCQLPHNFCECSFHKKLGCTAKSKYERAQVIEALKYMKARGINPNLSKPLVMGVGSCSTASIVKYLKTEGFDKNTDGWDKLFFPPNKEKGWGQAFRFRNYLVFGEPNGRGIAWLCGRSYKEDAKLPHNHQAGKPLSLVLGASSLPVDNYVALVTEGTIDYALARQWGYNAVCLNGTSNVLPEEQQRDADKVAKVLSGADVVVAAMDADESGSVALRSLKALMGDRLRPLVLPDGFNDIGDLGKIPGGENMFATAFYDSLD